MCGSLLDSLDFGSFWVQNVQNFLLCEGFERNTLPPWQHG
jgi:hypothetical protein